MIALIIKLIFSKNLFNLIALLFLMLTLHMVDLLKPNKYKPNYDSDYKLFLNDNLKIEYHELKNLSGERYRLEWDVETKNKI